MNKSIYQVFWERLPKRQAFLWLIPLLTIVGLEIGTTSFIPYTRKTVMDSLVAFDWNAFLFFTAIALGNSLVLNGVQAFKEWTSNKLSFLTREALMKTIKKSWVNKDGKTDLSNPCARLNDDTRLSTELALKVTIEIFISVIIVVSLLFTIVKWPLLLGIAVLYSAVSITVATLFKQPMIDRKYALSDAEGAHRVALTKISIQQGDYSSKVKWETLREKYTAYINIARNYRLFHSVQSAIMYSIPFMVMAPDYFAGKITIGDITQGTLTFDLLVINATIWVSMYPAAIEARTAFLRVKEFYEDVNK